MSPAILIAILIIGIAAMVLLTARFKVHPFVSLLLVAFGIAFAARLPITEIAGIITSGFGNILASIGIVIVLGTLIGVILERSGAALKMADIVVKIVGKNHPSLAMAIIGYIVSIPVFCDSGFVILSPLRRALTRKTGASAIAMSIALSMGLFATHNFVPPTPGPIAAAANLGLENHLILVIIIGMIVAVPATLTGLLYAVWVGKRIKSQEEQDTQTYEELLKSYGSLPDAFRSFAPIVMPILLMAIGSIAKFPGDLFGTGCVKTTCVFLGTPIVALFAGFLCSLTLLKQFNEETLTHWLGDGVKAAGTIIIITGAGGSLGAILKATDIGTVLGNTLAQMHIGILLPFVIAAAIKTAQGSSTVALVTTSAMIAPMMAGLGLDSEMGRVLAVMSIGGGAMTVSHANDSYFWVVTEFSKLRLADAYKTQTVATAIQGVTAAITVLLLSVVLL
ncbi:MAG: GntP family permease [Candidatus Sumerlaeales bacterium]|nr:GntP family permease [Candidatus Sumerlaeales bacterium]